MALLDVIDVLADPMFCEGGTIPVIRTAVTTGTNGRTQKTPTTIYINGVIQPADGDALAVLPEAERAIPSIVVYTTARLNVVRPGFLADQVMWRGDPYTVRLLNSFSNYGAGYVEAICQGRALLNGIDPEAPT